MSDRADRSDHHRDESPTEPRVVVRDRRKLDPVTGKVRQSAPDSPARAEAPPGAPDAAGRAAGQPADRLAGELAERTADLQRVTAEYANYRRRVERDRLVAGEQATAGVLAALLPVLDDIDRARQHGDLTGAFQAVAESLENILAKLGLTGFGEPGDPFDPTQHEAVTHSLRADVTEPSCVEVMRRGYAYGERLLRPAMVAVADPLPEPSAGPSADGSTSDTTGVADTPNSPEGHAE